MSHGTQFSIKGAAALLGQPVHRVRRWVRAGGLTGEGADASSRGSCAAGEAQLSFAGLVTLRSCAQLAAAGVTSRRIEGALRALRAASGDGGGSHDAALSRFRLSLHQGEIVAGDATQQWVLRSGQRLLRWPTRRADAVALSPRSLCAAAPPQPQGLEPDGLAAAELWFAQGVEHEETEPPRAYQAYLRALTCNPEHSEAMINVGRLCAEAGDHLRAAAFFRQAARTSPEQPVAHFNLGVTLQDLGDVSGAEAAYRQAVACDAGFADAHFNLAALLEQRGEHGAALTHMAAYRRAGGSDQPAP